MKRCKTALAWLLALCLLGSALFTAVAENSAVVWNVMYDWETDQTGTTPPAVTQQGDLAALKVWGLRQNGYENQLQTDSRQVLRFGNAGREACDPAQGGNPGLIALDTQAMQQATGLRVQLGVVDRRDGGCYDELAIGVVLNGIIYYDQVAATDFYNFQYYYFIGKTMTELGGTDTITLTAAHLKDITAIAGWSQGPTIGGLLIDQVEYTAQPDATSTAVLTAQVSPKPVVASGREIDYDPAKEDITMILVIGQSNATYQVGYPDELQAVADGYISEISELPVTPEKGTVYSSEAAVSDLTDRLDVATLIEEQKIGGFTPAFGTAWHAATGEKVVFIQAAVGGTMMKDWIKDPASGQALYSNAVRRFKVSYNSLKKKYNIVHTGYLWNQGESDDYLSPEETVTSAQTYYDYYTSMHNDLMEELPLDFGGMLMVRALGCGRDTATLNGVRAAQYRLCNEIDNLYIASRVFETCGADMMLMDEMNGIHALQKTYNLAGNEAAASLLNILQLNGEQPQLTGVSLYNAGGEKIAAFDETGTQISGDAARDCLGPVFAVAEPLGVPCKITWTVNGETAQTDGFGGFADLGLPYHTVFLQCSVNMDVQRGDVNGDGYINNKDYARLKAYLADDLTPIEKQAAELTGDQAISNKDLARLKAYLADDTVQFG